MLTDAQIGVEVSLRAVLALLMPGSFAEVMLLLTDYTPAGPAPSSAPPPAAPAPPRQITFAASIANVAVALPLDDCTEFASLTPLLDGYFRDCARAYAERADRCTELDPYLQACRCDHILAVVQSAKLRASIDGLGTAVDLAVFNAALFECERSERHDENIPHPILLFANSPADLQLDALDSRGYRIGKFLRPTLRPMDCDPSVVVAAKLPADAPADVRVVLAPALLTFDMTLTDRLYVWLHASQPGTATAVETDALVAHVAPSTPPAAAKLQLTCALLRVAVLAPVPTFTSNPDREAAHRPLRPHYRPHSMWLDMHDACVSIGDADAARITAALLRGHLVKSAEFEPKAFFEAASVDNVPVLISLALHSPTPRPVPTQAARSDVPAAPLADLQQARKSSPFTSVLVQREGGERQTCAATTAEAELFEATETAFAFTVLRMQLPQSRLSFSQASYDIFNSITSDLSLIQPWLPDGVAPPIAAADPRVISPSATAIVLQAGKLDVHLDGSVCAVLPDGASRSLVDASSVVLSAQRVHACTVSGWHGGLDTMLSLRMGGVDVQDRHGDRGVQPILHSISAETSDGTDCVRLGLQISPDATRGIKTTTLAVDVSAVAVHHRANLPGKHWASRVADILAPDAPAYPDLAPVLTPLTRINVHFQHSHVVYAPLSLRSMAVLQLGEFDMVTAIVPTAPASRMSFYFGRPSVHVTNDRSAGPKPTELSSRLIEQHLARVLEDRFIDLTITSRANELPQLQIELRNRRLELDCQADALSVFQQTIMVLLDDADLQCLEPDGDVPTAEQVDMAKQRIGFIERPHLHFVPEIEQGTPFVSALNDEMTGAHTPGRTPRSHTDASLYYSTYHSTVQRNEDESGPRPPVLALVAEEADLSMSMYVAVGETDSDDTADRSDELQDLNSTATLDATRESSDDNPLISSMANEASMSMHGAAFQPRTDLSAHSSPQLPRSSSTLSLQSTGTGMPSPQLKRAGSAAGTPRQASVLRDGTQLAIGPAQTPRGIAAASKPRSAEDEELARLLQEAMDDTVPASAGSSLMSSRAPSMAASVASVSSSVASLLPRFLQQPSRVVVPTGPPVRSPETQRLSSTGASFAEGLVVLKDKARSPAHPDHFASPGHRPPTLASQFVACIRCFDRRCVPVRTCPCPRRW